MTPEQVLTKQIMLWCGEHDMLCFHINVGEGLMANGSYFRTGLPKGSSDLWIITNNGQLIFCETKIKPRKPTVDQLNFISQMKQRGFKAFVAYSLEEFVDNMR